MTTRKEDILSAFESAIKTINTDNSINISDTETYTYQNTVTYTDRQFINVTENDIKNREMPWVIINNDTEMFSTLVGGNMENKIIVHVVGLVKADSNNKNLDTIMNNLQKDILLAILNDETLGGNCDYLYPLEVSTVDEMVYPYGGFIITFEITYTCKHLHL